MNLGGQTADCGRQLSEVAPRFRPWCAHTSSLVGLGAGAKAFLRM